MNKSYLYIQRDEEIGEVIEKIRESKDKEIILVVPLGAKSFSHYINLELFKKEVNDLKKIVYLSTDDEKINALARKIGLELFLDEVEERQIIDIRPPKKQKEEIKEEIETDLKVEITKKQFKILNLLKLISGYLLIISVISILVFILWQFFQPRAEIIIETDKLPFDINKVITLKDGQLKADLENKILPGKYIKIEINKTESVTTTGPIFTEEKPFLEVAFLNFSNENIPLVAGTRLNYQGNIFRTTERIILPKKNFDTPGQVTVLALPDTIKDDDLKIDVNTPLKIPALEGKKDDNGRLWSEIIRVQTAKEYDLSSLVKVSSVAPEDITKVKINLEKSLKDDIIMKFRLEHSQSFYIYDPSLAKIEIINVSHQVGAKTNKIYAVGKGTFETLITSKQEFNDFIKNLINKEILSENKNLVINQLNFEKTEILDLDSQRKIMVIGIKGQAILVPEINPETIKREIVDKKIEEVNNYFTKIVGVKKISIKIFPQWQNKLPNDYKKIKIKII